MNNDKNIDSLALYSLHQKLDEQKLKLIINREPALFENTSQNILATLKQVNSVKGWNDLVNTMIAAEEQDEQLIQFNMIRNRRVKGRSINGSAELFLMECRSPEAEQLKQELIDYMDQIDNIELELISLEDKENINSNIRNRKIIEGELKKRLNRLQDDYEKINKQFKKVNSI